MKWVCSCLCLHKHFKIPVRLNFHLPEMPCLTADEQYLWFFSHRRKQKMATVCFFLFFKLLLFSLVFNVLCICLLQFCLCWFPHLPFFLFPVLFLVMTFAKGIRRMEERGNFSLLEDNQTFCLSLFVCIKLIKRISCHFN